MEEKVEDERLALHEEIGRLHGSIHYTIGEIEALEKLEVYETSKTLKRSLDEVKRMLYDRVTK